MRFIECLLDLSNILPFRTIHCSQFVAAILLIPFVHLSGSQPLGLVVLEAELQHRIFESIPLNTSLNYVSWKLLKAVTKVCTKSAPSRPSRSTGPKLMIVMRRSLTAIHLAVCTFPKREEIQFF